MHAFEIELSAGVGFPDLQQAQRGEPHVVVLVPHELLQPLVTVPQRVRREIILQASVRLGHGTPLVVVPLLLRKDNAHRHHREEVLERRGRLVLGTHAPERVRGDVHAAVVVRASALLTRGPRRRAVRVCAWQPHPFETVRRATCARAGGNRRSTKHRRDVRRHAAFLTRRRWVGGVRCDMRWERAWVEKRVRESGTDGVQNSTVEADVKIKKRSGAGVQKLPNIDRPTTEGCLQFCVEIPSSL